MLTKERIGQLWDAARLPYDPAWCMDDSLHLFARFVEMVTRKEIEAAVLAERKECADIAENANELLANSTFDGIATAIRTRTPPMRISDAHKEKT